MPSWEMFPHKRRVPSNSRLICSISIDASSQGKSENGEATNTSAGKAKQRQRLKAIPLLSDEDSSVKEINRCEPALVHQDPKPNWGKEGGEAPPNVSSPRGEQLPPCNKRWCWKKKLLSLLELEDGREQGKGWDKKPTGSEGWESR